MIIYIIFGLICACICCCSILCFIGCLNDRKKESQQEANNEVEFDNIQPGVEVEVVEGDPMRTPDQAVYDPN